MTLSHSSIEAAGCPKCADGGTDRVDITIDDEATGALFCMKCEHEWTHETPSTETPSTEGWWRDAEGNLVMDSPEERAKVIASA